MKLKTLIAATALVAISGSAMAATNLDAFSGQIQFNGGFITQTCNVYVDASNSGAGSNGVAATNKSGYIIAGYQTVGEELVQNTITTIPQAEVSLGYYPLTALSASTKTTTAQPFTIQLSDCEAGAETTGTDVGLGFTADTTAGNIINVTGKNAGVVGIGLSAGTTATPYLAMDGTSVATANIPEGETESNAVEFNAQYVLVGDSAKIVQGAAPALVTLNVIY